MKKNVLCILISCFVFLFAPAQHASAVENPLNVANNKIGIHILFGSELKDASELVNSNNGDWGYVTIVIQAGDKDLSKWQDFMNQAKKFHVIPIIRLATEGDFFNTQVWRKPNETDIVDFANFLNSLDWPVKNRYVIIFNEVNRGEEWGGSADPTDYAQLLSYAVTVFKSKNPDFFIIPSGLDNAAPNQGQVYINEYNYMRGMDQAVPGIFNQIDGLSSHSYPNPGFSQPPGVNTPMSINSFQYERSLVKSLSQKNLPVFITETGWSVDSVSDNYAASYYVSALNSVWNDPGIVAITPFLLQGRGGPFQKFSLFGANGIYTQQYTAIKNFPKAKGNPISESTVLSAQTINQERSAALPTRDFSKQQISKKTALKKQLQTIFQLLVRI